MDPEEWRNGIKPERKVRSYRHIDDPLDIGNDKTFARVADVISNIKKHQFLPFIKRAETVIRFRKNKQGQLFRTPKTRPIMYASHIDSHIYSFYNYHLLKAYNAFLSKEGLSENIIAYRKIEDAETGKGKSNVHFAKEVFEYLRGQEQSVVITQDIEGFFDNINHALLKKKIQEIVDEELLDESLFKVFKSLTAYRYIEYSDFEDKKFQRRLRKTRYAVYSILKPLVRQNKMNKGIPQGSPISGLLANVSLVDFDRSIKKEFPDVFYRRYSDDLVFICRSDQKDTLLSHVDAKIRSSFLNINAKKSFISYFQKIGEHILCVGVTDGLGKKLGRNYVDYLGLEFNGKNIFLRKNTIQKLKRKQIVRAEKGILNSVKQKRFKPKRLKILNSKHRNNYLRKAVEVVDDQGIQRQVLKVTRDRNKVKNKLPSGLIPETELGSNN